MQNPAHQAADTHRVLCLISRTTGAFDDQAQDLAAAFARVFRHTNLKLRDVAAEPCRTGDPPRAGHAQQSVASLAPGHGRTAA